MPNPVIICEFVPPKDVNQQKNLSAVATRLDIHIGPPNVFSIEKDDKTNMQNMCKVVVEALKVNPTKSLLFKVNSDLLEGFKLEVKYYLSVESGKQKLDSKLVEQMKKSLEASEFRGMQVVSQITPNIQEKTQEPHPKANPLHMAQLNLPKQQYQRPIAAPPAVKSQSPSIKESMEIVIINNNKIEKLEEVPDMANRDVVNRVMFSLANKLWNSNVTSISVTLPKNAQEGFKMEIKNQLINFLAYNDKVREKLVDDKKLKKACDMVDNIKFTEPSIKQDASNLKEEKASYAPAPRRP